MSKQQHSTTCRTAFQSDLTGSRQLPGYRSGRLHYVVASVVSDDTVRTTITPGVDHQPLPGDPTFQPLEIDRCSDERLKSGTVHEALDMATSDAEEVVRKSLPHVRFYSFFRDLGF